jgi:hypothetical protein
MFPIAEFIKATGLMFRLSICAIEKARLASMTGVSHSAAADCFLLFLGTNWL